MPKAELKDITLYHEVYGKGFPLLLIAGLGSDHSSWLGVAKTLSLHFQVIVYDNRGSGRSDCADKPFSIRQMADDAIGLLDHLKIRSCHVLGHSMGGYIAQEMAIHYPAYIDKLILESTAAVSSQRNNRLFEDFLRQRQREANPEAWITRWVFWLFSAERFTDKTFIETFIKNVSRYRYTQSPASFRRQIEAIAAFDTRGRTNRIKAHAMVMEGERDILLLPEEAQALAEAIPACVYGSVKNAAHCIHLEAAKAFVESVLKFLQS